MATKGERQLLIAIRDVASVSGATHETHGVKSGSMSYTQRFSYLNDTETELRLMIEPWADEFPIAPGQQVDVRIEAEGEGGIELHQFAGGLVIWSNFLQFNIAVMLDGQELDPSPSKI